MGLVVDSCILIRAERTGRPSKQIVARLAGEFLFDKVVISVVSVVELTHGIYRAKSSAISQRRREFVDDVVATFGVAPLSLEIAALAGRIEGEQAAIGNTIDFADVLIGATALYFGYELATFNVDHFRRIPGLRVVVPTL